MRKLMAVAGVVALASVLMAVAVAVAASGDSSRTQAKAAQRIVGTGKGGGCGMAYDTETATLVPPDDSTTDNVPAATVTLKRNCVGPVVGQFSTEVNTSTASDFVHIDLRATCTGTGGLTNPCTVGQVAFAYPGHTFLQSGQSVQGTRTASWVWAGLPRGIWKFEVLPGGDNNASLVFRTFTVEAFG